MSMAGKMAVSAVAALAFTVLAFGSADPDKASQRAQDRAPTQAESAPAPLEAAGPSMGGWRTSTQTDPMTDGTTTLAVLTWKVKGWLTEPEITVRCKDNKTDVIYDFQEAMTRTRLRSGFQRKARFRWDDGAAEDRTFDEAEGATTAVFSSRPIPDAKKLRTHKRLRVPYTKVLGGDVTDHDVDLTGADVALAEVAEACGC